MSLARKKSRAEKIELRERGSGVAISDVKQKEESRSSSYGIIGYQKVFMQIKWMKVTGRLSHLKKILL